MRARIYIDYGGEDYSNGKLGLLADVLWQRTQSVFAGLACCCLG